MKQTVTKSMFHDAFSFRKENFSYEGLTALYDYLTDLEDDIGEEIELDPIALCCDYTEFKNLDEFKEAYEKDNDFTFEDLEDETTVIQVNSERFIILSY